MPGFLSPRKGVPLFLNPEYSGTNKGQRVPDRSKAAHRKHLVKCFLTLSELLFILKKQDIYIKETYIHNYYLEKYMQLHIMWGWNQNKNSRMACRLEGSVQRIMLRENFTEFKFDYCTMWINRKREDLERWYWDGKKRRKKKHEQNSVLNPQRRQVWLVLEIVEVGR